MVTVSTTSNHRAYLHIASVQDLLQYLKWVERKYVSIYTYFACLPYSIHYKSIQLRKHEFIFGFRNVLKALAHAKDSHICYTCPLMCHLLLQKQIISWLSIMDSRVRIELSDEMLGNCTNGIDCYKSSIYFTAPHLNYQFLFEFHIIT